MPTTSQLLREALRHQQANNRAAAESSFRAVLAEDDKNADAWHLLGVLLGQHSEAESGLQCVLKAIDLIPNHPVYHGNAGVLLRMLGRTEEAIEHYRSALRLQPDLADAHSNLANLLSTQGHVDQAFTHYQHAIWHKPHFAEAYFGIGRLLFAKGRRDEAIGYCRAAVEMKSEMPDAYDLLCEMYLAAGRTSDARAAIREALRLRPSAAAHFRLATILQSEGKLSLAADSYRAALAIQPQMAAAHGQLGGLLTQQGQFGAAASHFEQALAIAPELPEAHCGLGIIGLRQASYQEAAAHFRRAIAIRRDFVEAINSLATCCVLLGRRDEAHGCYERMLHLRPDHYDAHCDRSMLLLSEGRYIEGWREYEWRWKRPDVRSARFLASRWTGEMLPDKTLLIHTEQGLGDTLQFVRFAALARQRVGRVIVECAPSLTALLDRVPWIDQTVVLGSPLPAYDVHAPMMSLPGVFGTTLETIPNAVPYLTPSRERTDAWSEAFGNRSGLRVGINWQGSTTHAMDHLRSLALANFAPLANIRGVQLYSLQVGAGHEQLAASPFREKVIDLAHRLGDFENTAAAISHLDVIITCDSALGHLAGATGKPCWILLPYAADWRWLLERVDSPWYPTVRLFRQATSRNWDDVVTRVSTLLSEWAREEQ